jgi:hypothetical protein
MGLLAKKGMLFVLIFFGMASCGWSDEDLFRLTTVDYFGVKARQKENADSGYHPPSVVSDLLDDPSEQTALAYLCWQRERLDRITRAQAILDKVMANYGNYGDMYQIQ